MFVLRTVSDLAVRQEDLGADSDALSALRLDAKELRRVAGAVDEITRPPLGLFDEGMVLAPLYARIYARVRASGSGRP